VQTLSPDLATPPRCLVSSPLCELLGETSCILLLPDTSCLLRCRLVQTSRDLAQTYPDGSPVHAFPGNEFPLNTRDRPGAFDRVFWTRSSRVHGSRVHGGRVYGGRVYGGRVYGGRVYGGRVYAMALTERRAHSVCSDASFVPWPVKGPSTGRMTWDPAALQRHCWAVAEPAGRPPRRTAPSTGEADSGYMLERERGRERERPTRDTRLHAREREREGERERERGRLGIPAWMPRRTSWTYRAARDALASFHVLPGPLAGTSESTGVMGRLPEAVPNPAACSRPLTACGIG
jgi:hypothetical protein